MAKKSTNKWSLERSRESVNALLKKAAMEPLLVEVLSDLLWVVDHQQDQLEQMYAWTKYIIEQALVDHARGDGVVQINETCHQAIKDWYYTEPVTAAAQAVQESSVGSDASLSDERLKRSLTAVRLLTVPGVMAPEAAQAIQDVLSEVERLRAVLAESERVSEMQNKYLTYLSEENSLLRGQVNGTADD